MKLHFRILLLIGLPILIISCNDEEVLPEKKIVDVSTSTKDSSNAASPAQSAAIAPFPDSAFYQYQSFESMPYRIMFPRKYSSASNRYPLVIFLHGIDERGIDNEKQLLWGASLFQSDSISKKYPAFVVFPQCPSTSRWVDDPPAHTLKALIDHVVETYHIDKNRIYIVGLSMGAYGTYNMVARYPGFFAAAVAIAGDGDEDKASEMAKTQWRIFAGKKDTVVPSEKSVKIVNALERSGARVNFTLYPNANHMGSWVNAFAEADFCAWLFSRSK